MVLWESARYIHVSLISVDVGFPALNEECFLYVTFWSTSRKWSVKVQSTGKAKTSYLTPCGAMKVKSQSPELTKGELRQKSTAVCFCFGCALYCSCKKLLFKNCNYSLHCLGLIMQNNLIAVWQWVNRLLYLWTACLSFW